MTIVDANVLLYAVNEDAVHHQSARRWLQDALGSGRPVALVWIALLAFLRLSTKSNVFPRPLTTDDAAGIVRTWIAHPSTIVLAPTARHADVLASLLAEVGTGGNLVSDAHLAALAVEHDAEIVSYDGDFARFTGVRWRTPGV